MEVEAGPRVDRARAHQLAAGSLDRSRLSGQRRLIQDGVPLEQAVDGNDLARLDEETVGETHLVDRSGVQLAILVPIDLLGRSLEQVGELPVRPAIRVGLERLSARQHQDDHGSGQVLVESEATDDRQQRDPVDAELASRE